MQNTTVVLDKPEQIMAAQLLARYQMLKLETQGLKRSHSPSAYALVRRAYNLVGTRASVLTQLGEMKMRLLYGESHLEAVGPTMGGQVREVIHQP